MSWQDDQWLWCRFQFLWRLHIQYTAHRVSAWRDGLALVVPLWPLRLKHHFPAWLNSSRFKDVLADLPVQPAPEIYTVGSSHNKIISWVATESQGHWTAFN